MKASTTYTSKALVTNKNKTMPTIRQLERDLRKNHRERHAINDQIETLRTKRELPALKRKLEGKYFKYQNSYNAGTSWNIYAYCHTVISPDRAIVDRFECDPRGKWEFKTYAKEGLYLFQTEITQKEYEKASTEFISAAMTIRQLK